jgi:flagellar basal-body rod protein FlgC
MYGALETSTSGMVAQRTRMAVIASNIANSNTILNAQGEYDPYRRRAAMLAPGSPEGGMGVRVQNIHVEQDSLVPKYMPESPFRDAEGYVMVPDIDPTMEWVNGMQASRAYEANVVAAETSKNMLAQALRLLA